MAVDGGQLLGLTTPARPSRGRAVLAVAAVAALATGAAVFLPRLRDGSRSRSDVVAGGDPAPQLPAPAALTVDVEVAPGWQMLRADGYRLVVGTRNLEGRDLVLALLARDDAAFAAFPADGTVFVVGADRLQAKYRLGSPVVGGLTAVPDPAAVSGPAPPVNLPASVVDGPGPPLALGAPKALSGGVTVRTGDVPRSMLWLAAYAGPRAPAVQMQEAEAMAGTVKVIAPEPGAIQPPPPAGSRPGFDKGGVDLVADQLPTAVSINVPASTYAAKAQGDCAVVVENNGSFTLAGGCTARPPTPTTEVLAVTLDLGPPPLPPPGQRVAPGTVRPWDRAMVVLARVGPGVGRLTGLLTDGRSIDLTVGADGWALGATDGRIFLLETMDRAGKVLGVTPVT